MKPSVSPDHCVAAGVGICVLLLTKLMYAMPLRLTITPAGQAVCCQVPWYCVNPSMVAAVHCAAQPNGAVCRTCEVTAEGGRINRDLESPSLPPDQDLIVGAATGPPPPLSSFASICSATSLGQRWPLTHTH